MKCARIAIIVAATLLGFAGSSEAQNQRRGRQDNRSHGSGDFIQRLDQDGDGRVSRDEFDGPAEHFNHMDRDADGYIDDDEAPQGPPPGRREGNNRQSNSQRGNRGNEGGFQRDLGDDQGGPPQGGGGFVARLDQDGDDRVSENEFDGPAEHFSHFDANGDGYITDDEAPQGPPPRGRGQSGQRFGNQPGNGPVRLQSDSGGDQSGRNGRRQGGGFIDHLDRDGDGRVSEEEFDGPSDAFSHLDQNGDGYLSSDEAPQGPPPGQRGRGRD